MNSSKSGVRQALRKPLLLAEPGATVHPPVLTFPFPCPIFLPMSEYISPSEFLRLRDEGLPLIDVRLTFGICPCAYSRLAQSSPVIRRGARGRGDCPCQKRFRGGSARRSGTHRAATGGQTWPARGSSAGIACMADGKSTGTERRKKEFCCIAGAAECEAGHWPG